MRIRPYCESDFQVISNWRWDERLHALWCGNLLPFPLEKEEFADALRQLAERFGDSPFVAAADDGRVIGFFSFSLNRQNGEGMLKFVVVDDAVRNQGYGGEMVKLALRHAFESAGAQAVHLNVYTENPGARRCYEKLGFRDRSLAEKDFRYQGETWGKYNMIFTK